MSAREIQVTFDCADPRALSLFWNEVLGYVLPPSPPGFESWDAFSASLPDEQRNSASACVDPDGTGPRLFFQRVPEPKTAKNRVHLDLQVGPERAPAEVERLTALGATVAWTTSDRGPLTTTLRDPEGNELCVS